MSKTFSEAESLAESLGLSFENTDAGRSATHPHETKDCTVRAVAGCLGVPYEAAHALLEKEGRPPRRGYPFRESRFSYLQKYIEPRPELTCCTVATAVRQMQAGRYIIRIRRHAFAVVDGVIKDLGCPNPLSKVEMVYSKIDSETPPVQH